MFPSFPSHQIEMSLAYLCCIQAFLWNAWELVCKRPSFGFWASTAFSSKGSDLYRAFLTRLCCTFRFSQPLGTLFHQCSFGLVSYRIHPWGFAFRGFPLSEAATALAALCPSSKWANMSPSMLLGIMRLKDPFFTKWFYPFLVSRSPLSLLPLRGFFTLEPWYHWKMISPLMGFL
jgi:hypothetical protein